MSSAPGPPPPPSSSSSPDLTERLADIRMVETQIGELLRLSQSCVGDLAKERQITKGRMDEASQQFKNTLTSINQTLSSQMSYLQNVCVGSAHQGSTVASQQNIELAKAAELALHKEMAALTQKHFPSNSKK